MKLNVFGIQFDLGKLREPQTGQTEMRELRGEFSEHLISSISPKKLAQSLEDAEKGDLRAQANLAEDFEERVPHLHAEFSKRKRAAMPLPYRIAPPEERPTSWEKGYAEELSVRMRSIEIQSWRPRDVDDTSDSPGMPDVFFSMLDGLMYSYSCSEMAWDQEGKDWTPRLYHRPPSWFITPTLNRNKLMVRSTDQETIVANGESETVSAKSLRPWGWITHTHRAKSGYLTRGGLVRVISFPSLYLLYAVNDFAELLHILGIPPLIGKYPQGASLKEKNAFLAGVTSLGRKSRAIIPKDMEIQFFQHAQLQGDHFMNMIRWAEASISKAVVGGTLVTDAQSKTNALTKAKSDVDEFWELTKSDVFQLNRTLTRDFVLPFSMLNATKGRVDERRPYRFIIDTNEAADLKEFGDALAAFGPTGFLNRIPVPWVHEKTRIPEPRVGETTLGDLLPVTQPAGAEPLARQKEAALRAGREPSYERAPLDAIAEGLAENEWQPMMGPMLEPLLAALEQIENVDALDEAGFDAVLAEAVKGMDLGPLEEHHFRAFMMSHIFGRSVPPEEWAAREDD